MVSQVLKVSEKKEAVKLVWTKKEIKEEVIITIIINYNRRVNEVVM